MENREFAPSGTGRNTPAPAIILTSADVDCVLGLLHLREFQPLRIYATASVRRVLTEENSLFRTLERSRPPVEWISLPVNEGFPSCSKDDSAAENGDMLPGCTARWRFPGLCERWIAAEPTSGRSARWPGTGAEREADVLCSEHSGERQQLETICGMESDLSLLDGTFWTNDELVRVMGSGKTAREMGHMPLSEEDGLLKQMGNVRGGRRILIHMNNTNPLLDEESEANRAAREAGWEIAYDGMEFEL